MTVRLIFKGEGAGLGVALGGDVNNPMSYEIECQCGSNLGPLARFPARQHQGRSLRSAGCPVCFHIVVVDDKAGQILTVLEMNETQKTAIQAAVQERLKMGESS